MDAIFEQAVRERAYALWLEAGRVHGLDRAHWLAAETAIKCAAGATAFAKPAKAKPGVARKAGVVKAARVAAKVAGKARVAAATSAQMVN